MNETWLNLKATALRYPVLSGIAGLLVLAEIVKLTPMTGSACERPTASAVPSAAALPVSAEVKSSDRFVVSDDTSCEAAVQAFGSGDKKKIYFVDKYVQKVMRAEDSALVSQGQRSLIGHLSPEGFTGIRSMAITYCRQDPHELLQHAAIEAYSGTRSLQKEAGVL